MDDGAPDRPPGRVASYQSQRVTLLGVHAILAGVWLNSPIHLSLDDPVLSVNAANFDLPLRRGANDIDAHCPRAPFMLPTFLPTGLGLPGANPHGG